MLRVDFFSLAEEPEPTDSEDLETFYFNGPLDLCSVFFYLLICIVVHAVVQEYVLDVSKTGLQFSF